MISRKEHKQQLYYQEKALHEKKYVMLEKNTGNLNYFLIIQRV